MKDHGFCQNCKNNTYGPRCNECAINSYYNVLTQNCVSCGCNLDGVLGNASIICDRVIFCIFLNKFLIIELVKLKFLRIMVPVFASPR